MIRFSFFQLTLRFLKRFVSVAFLGLQILNLLTQFQFPVAILILGQFCLKLFDLLRLGEVLLRQLLGLLPNFFLRILTQGIQLHDQFHLLFRRQLGELLVRCTGGDHAVIDHLLYLLRHFGNSLRAFGYIILNPEMLTDLFPADCIITGLTATRSFVCAKDPFVLLHDPSELNGGGVDDPALAEIRFHQGQQDIVFRAVALGLVGIAFDGGDVQCQTGTPPLMTRDDGAIFGNHQWMQDAFLLDRSQELFPLLSLDIVEQILVHRMRLQVSDVLFNQHWLCSPSQFLGTGSADSITPFRQIRAARF